MARAYFSVEGIRRCYMCKSVKDETEFYKRPSGTYGNLCKECHKLYQRARARYLSHGMTREGYLILIEKQNNKCAICGKEGDLQKTSLVIDHNHETGKVRSLLCQSCNTAIGLFHDDIQTLNQAVVYLTEHQ
jgi:hypothetical protein